MATHLDSFKESLGKFMEYKASGYAMMVIHNLQYQRW